MCTRHITHWQSCHHQRCTGIEICKYAEARPGLDPSNCPKGKNVFGEQAEAGECGICREMGGRNSERREESVSIGTGSAESGSTERDSVERGGHGGEKHRDERHDSTGKDGEGEGRKDKDKCKAKKEDEDRSQWDGTAALLLETIAHASS
jgi:hypothetical protein